MTAFMEPIGGGFRVTGPPGLRPDQVDWSRQPHADKRRRVVVPGRPMKVCEICLAPFTRPPSITNKRWAEQRSCSKQCGVYIAISTKRAAVVVK